MSALENSFKEQWGLPMGNGYPGEAHRIAIRTGKANIGRKHVPVSEPGGDLPQFRMVATARQCNRGCLRFKDLFDLDFEACISRFNSSVLMPEKQRWEHPWEPINMPAFFSLRIWSSSMNPFLLIQSVVIKKTAFRFTDSRTGRASMIFERCPSSNVIQHEGSSARHRKSPHCSGVRN